MNDICRVSNTASIVLFADDTNIFFESDVNDSNVHAEVSLQLNKFNDWFAANKLSLDVDHKTNYRPIVFHALRIFCWDKNILMGGKRLQQVYTIKFLGAY